MAEHNIHGWRFRSAKMFKTNTICSFIRLPGANTYCKICNKDHDTDNTFQLRLTATKIEEFCFRAHMNN